MLIVDVSVIFPLAHKGRGVLALGLAGLLLANGGVWAQSSEAVSTPPVTDTTALEQAVEPKLPVMAAPLPITPRIVSLMPRWIQLTPTQQQSLSPLESTWDSLADGHRRKWIALAENYHSLTSEEQSKLHSRMAEWSALNPRERELARLNFAESKKLPVPDRTANWEAYKALSANERKQLGESALTKPKGAAATVKPVLAGKLTPVPVTRHTPLDEKQRETIKAAIDRNTLLPKTPPPLK
jgi:DNA-binding CsgD family transcriptional regulator